MLLGARDGVQGDALVHLSAFERSGGRLAVVADEAAWASALPMVEQADVVVDAVLGTGLRAEPGGLPALAIGALLARFEAGVPVVAVDQPSGLPSDSGLCDWPSARATVTVTFAAPKRCHVLPPACDQAGELLVVDIGIPAAVVAKSEPSLFLLEDQDAAAAFPQRRPGAHKGEFGHLLIVAGSVGKTGAAVLAAGGALRSGVGLVTVATPEPCVALVAACAARGDDGAAGGDRGRRALGRRARAPARPRRRARRRRDRSRPRPGPEDPGPGAGVRALRARCRWSWTPTP